MFSYCMVAYSEVGVFQNERCKSNKLFHLKNGKLCIENCYSHARTYYVLLRIWKRKMGKLCIENCYSGMLGLIMYC